MIWGTDICWAEHELVSGSVQDIAGDPADLPFGGHWDFQFA
jgi:hypothetical protein